ncbi:MAG TPA: CmcJ/NvfI family oxidoreductase [Acidimicrobiales bacterium]|nr:CmcJ/NvfI family oxidoreductase [Acidimicrobiales bacterium]
MKTFCRAVLNYLPRIQGAPSPTEVDIFDGRAAQLPGWQECGFELVQHRSTISDWVDEEALASVHHPEMEELARKMTNADVALVSSHIKRSPKDAQRHHQLSPITFVHSDFAAGYTDLIRRNYHEASEPSPALARHGLTADDVDRATRTVILQFWRNLGEPKMDFPLAFCDARTVTPEDSRAFRVTDYAGSGFSFDALGIVAPEPAGRHRWYAFPELGRDETVAFRTYDTDLVARGETWFTPHSAFRDPEVPVGSPARTSIELRANCLWF